MPSYISETAVDDILRMLNMSIRETDRALDGGADAYGRWVKWRAQHATSADAASALNTASGVTWITGAIIDVWASAFAAFDHLQKAATGTEQPAKDCYYDWNSIIP